jgi:hypothetical protein
MCHRVSTILLPGLVILIALTNIAVFVGHLDAQDIPAAGEPGDAPSAGEQSRSDAQRRNATDLSLDEIVAYWKSAKDRDYYGPGVISQ